MATFLAKMIVTGTTAMIVDYKLSKFALKDISSSTIQQTIGNYATTSTVYPIDLTNRFWIAIHAKTTLTSPHTVTFHANTGATSTYAQSVLSAMGRTNWKSRQACPRGISKLAIRARTATDAEGKSCLRNAIRVTWHALHVIQTSAEIVFQEQAEMWLRMFINWHQITFK